MKVHEEHCHQSNGVNEMRASRTPLVFNLKTISINCVCVFVYFIFNQWMESYKFRDYIQNGFRIGLKLETKIVGRGAIEIFQWDMLCSARMRTLYDSKYICLRRAHTIL